MRRHLTDVVAMAFEEAARMHGDILGTVMPAYTTETVPGAL